VLDELKADDAYSPVGGDRSNVSKHGDTIVPESSHGDVEAK